MSSPKRLHCLCFQLQPPSCLGPQGSRLPFNSVFP
uniref:Anti-CLST11240 hypothetical frame-1 protein n=1 Tax=Homo sapiens TaxID=9606 RepID=Q76K26_HUMAN|nr:anti-CLST11240 hypothetical frame-1 protein [Homo sapiens]